MKLLTVGNPKTMRGEAVGYRTFILHLAPSTLSGYQVCPMASKGCAAACLNTAGRGAFAKTQEARIRKTKWFFEDRDTFMAQLVKDIRAAVRNAERAGLIPCVRLNGTSDLRWENVPVEGFKNVMEAFPTVQFYDYTKLHNRRALPKNYHLTFSRSESNNDQAEQLLGRTNVAVVFGGKELPKAWHNVPVIDGLEDDLRFLDPEGVVVGLLAKGKAKRDTSGFVVIAG